MDPKELEEDLNEVATALAAAKTEYARLGARIAGLEAQHAALIRAFPGEALGADPSQSVSSHRTDDIVDVLMARGTPMSIREVVSSLRELNRPGENYDNVSVDLAYLAGRKRVERVSRGVYTASPQVRLDGATRRVIQLTQGNIRNGHVYLSRCIDFFPEDTLGGPSRSAELGKPVELTFEGCSDGPVETDIASDKKIFRIRTEWKEFFARHALQPGDSVVLERRSEYSYHVSVDRDASDS
jgi:hypothetical protein